MRRLSLLALCVLLAACGSIPKDDALRLDAGGGDAIVIGGLAVAAIPDGPLGLKMGALYDGIRMRWANATDPSAPPLVFEREHGALCVTFTEPPCDMSQAVYYAQKATPGVYRLDAVAATGPNARGLDFDYPPNMRSLENYEFVVRANRVNYMGDIHWAPHEGVISSEFKLFRGTRNQVAPRGVIRVREAAAAAALQENFPNVADRPTFTGRNIE